MATPRSNFGIEVIDDKLMVVGGYNGQRTSADVEAYDDTTNEWYAKFLSRFCNGNYSTVY